MIWSDQKLAELTEHGGSDGISALRDGDDQCYDPRSVFLGKFEICDHRRNGDGVTDAKAEEHDADHEDGWTASVGEEEHAASQRLRNKAVRRDSAPVRGARCAPADGDAADDGGNAGRAGGKPSALPSERGCEHRDEVRNEPGLREQGQGHSDAQRKNGAIAEKVAPGGRRGSFNGRAGGKGRRGRRAAVGGLVQALGRSASARSRPARREWRASPR